MLLSVTETTAVYVSKHPRACVRRASGLVQTRYSEVGRAGGGGATMILPGETEAALRGRNHAEG